MNLTELFKLIQKDKHSAKIHINNQSEDDIIQLKFDCDDILKIIYELCHIDTAIPKDELLTQEVSHEAINES